MTRPDFIRSRLSIAEVDALKEELSASQAERQSLHACIARIWKVLGINTYEGANGKELSELVADALTSSRTEAAALREALAKAAPKLAVLEYLLEGCSYSYGESSASEPSPPEFGIAWQWQASTPERPSMWEQLVKDATDHFDQHIGDIDDEAPSDFERECIAHRAALLTGGKA